MNAYYCICFIYNRFLYHGAMLILSYIYIEAEGDGKPRECASEMEVVPPYHAPTRFCRHTGPDEKSSACGICKLVCSIQ